MSSSSDIAGHPISGVGMESLMQLRMDAAADAITERIRSAQDPSTPDGRTELQEAAEQFEAYILRMLLAEMRKSVQDDGLFENRQTKGYTAILDDALTRKAAEAGTFGLAEQIVRQMEGRS